MSWTRVIHLERWADTLEARGQLPLLVRRLVKRTVPSLKSATFPAFEESQRAGFDGEVETVEGTQFVPSGQSAWEMGVNKTPLKKAEEDFKKRTEQTPIGRQRETAFVFVTPRSWPEAANWAKSKAAHSSWRTVLALDANDLEHWMEAAPDIDRWFTRVTRYPTSQIQDLESYWITIQSIADTALAASVFTASRELEIATVKKWLSGPAASLFMKTSGLTDGLDFLAALCSGEGQERLQDGLIVHSEAVWRDLAATADPLLLIAAPTLELQATETAAAVNSGHYVFLSGPRANIASATGETLRRQDYYSMREALITSGYSESRAMSLACACCGSSSILKRLITKHPETVFPTWCRDEWRASLAPFALIGGWTNVDPTPYPRGPNSPRLGSDPPIDVEFVTELVGCDRIELERLVSRWQDGPEPLFMCFGNTVLVTSREDTWHLLGGAITRDQLKRFSDLAVLVLEENNPAFELAPDQRWMASLYGKRHALSEDLRHAFVETLALMTTYPRMSPLLSDSELKEAVAEVLEELLPTNATWQRWASFGRNLPIVAEADPGLFLRRIEADLATDEPELPQLFQDQSKGMFSAAIHSDLLWSLEGLAWSGEYLSRVAVCLGKLAARDPGGSYANRPFNSLEAIFLLWLWHTNASLRERMSALSAVLAAEHVIGWKLLKILLPTGMSKFSTNTHMPRWRPWADGWSREKLRPQMAEYCNAVANLTIQTAGSDPKLWSEVLDGLLRISAEITGKVFEALEYICNTAASPTTDATFELWNELRRLVLRHERYSHADWAFDEKIQGRLKAIRDRLQPADALRQHHWLFDHRAELQDVDIKMGVETHDKALQDRRLAALQTIIAENGPDGVFRLLNLTAGACTIGWLVGANGLLDWSVVGLPAILDATEKQRLDFIAAFISGRWSAEGFSFVDRLPIAEWSAAQIATLARCLPFQRETWQWVERLGGPVASDYWSHVTPLLRSTNTEDIRTATHMLIRAHRPFGAIDVLHSALLRKAVLPSVLVAEVLESAVALRDSEASGEASDIEYAIQQLVKALQDNKEFDQSRLARIEWGLLPVLEPEFSEVQPTTLFTAIKSDPRLYVGLLQCVYREEHAADSSSQELATEQQQLMAFNAHKLLERMQELPGTSEDGSIDCDYLRKWMTDVRLLAAECDRRTVCELVLGRFTARALQAAEEDWPPPELAKLMEEMGSEGFFDGFINGVINSRGVVSRAIGTGGEPERRLAERFGLLERKIRPVSGKVAQAFHEVANHYETYARREDEEAHRERTGRW